MHVISVNDFDKNKLNELFLIAKDFRKQLTQSVNTSRQLSEKYTGYSLCNLFYEPSTRTRFSFGQAALELGLTVQQTENAGQFSSAAKGETLEDTIRVLNELRFNIIVLRHPEIGAAKRAAKVSEASIINAGDGAGEHPTQSLLDIFTIYDHFGRLDNLKIVLGGDLKYGRTVRSLVKLLSRYNGNHFTFVSTKELQMKRDVLDELEQNNYDYELASDLLNVFENADVVYWTRLQKERADGHADDAGDFVINQKTLRNIPKEAIIMHPLPRVDEINPEIDNDSRVAYFEQAGNGLYIRMALISMILDQK